MRLLQANGYSWHHPCSPNGAQVKAYAAKQQGNRDKKRPKRKARKDRFRRLGMEEDASQRKRIESENG
jgi:hypothetical protein